MWQKICVHNLDFHSDKLFYSWQKPEANTPLFSDSAEVYFSTMVSYKGADMWILLTITCDSTQHRHFQSYFCYFVSFWCREPFCMCVGWESREPWGPFQLFRITAMPMCSKKILWGRPECCGACFVLPEQNENLGKWQKIFLSLVWIAHLKHRVLFKFLLWTICCLLLELQ